MKKILLFIMLFPSFVRAEEFTLRCEGNREFHSYIDEGMSFDDKEIALLRVKKDSMEYIGVNSGRKYTFGNKEYTAPKRAPHEDIKIKERYEVTLEKITASQTITDLGSSNDSTISVIRILVDRLTAKLTEVDNIRNKKTLKISKSNNFKASCKKEMRPL
jgi:hypothetical protein